MKAICILLVSPVGKSTHLYSITDNFLPASVYPGRSGRPCPTRPQIVAGPVLVKPLAVFDGHKQFHNLLE